MLHNRRLRAQATAVLLLLIAAQVLYTSCRQVEGEITTALDERREELGRLLLKAEAGITAVRDAYVFDLALAEAG